ncbi:MAG: glycerophosphodiester phosphodiesterase family protein [Bdellovibrionales bacterium]
MSSLKVEFIPPFIAHRGAPKLAPENSLESFIVARDSGAKWIETDVKLTSDGIPILIHDETLDRTTNGQGLVSQTSWKTIQTLDAGSWFSPAFSNTRVTSLTEMLTFCSSSRMRLILELKPSPGRTQATVMVTLIEASKMWPENLAPPMIASFDVDSLVISAQLRPDWPRGLFFEKWENDWVEMAVITQATTITFKEDLLTPDRLEILRRSPVPILAYTVDDPARAKELMKNGIKAVFSDDVPALFKGRILS